MERDVWPDFYCERKKRKRHLLNDTVNVRDDCHVTNDVICDVSDDASMTLNMTLNRVS